MIHSFSGHLAMMRGLFGKVIFSVLLFVQSGFAMANAPLATVYVISVQYPKVDSVEGKSALEEQPDAPVYVEQNKPVQAGVMTKRRAKPWYRKIRYFVDVNREIRAIEVSRDTGNAALAQSKMDADYHATVVSLTAGGNLLPNTQFYWDVRSEKYVLEGNLVDTGITGVQNIAPLRFDRYELLSEWFIQTDLSRGWAIGADIYHSRSRYRDSVSDDVFTDKEFGAGLQLSKTFRFARSDLHFDYILSHRLVKPGDASFEQTTRTFHNVISTYQHQWHFNWHTQVTARGSYYPVVDPMSFWEATHIWSLGAEVNYFPSASHKLALKADHVWLGSEDSIRILSLTYEYQFGVSKTKRRKRQRRIPQLLIR